MGDGGRFWQSLKYVAGARCFRVSSKRGDYFGLDGNRLVHSFNHDTVKISCNKAWLLKYWFLLGLMFYLNWTTQWRPPCSPHGGIWKTVYVSEVMNRTPPHFSNDVCCLSLDMHMFRVGSVGGVKLYYAVVVLQRKKKCAQKSVQEQYSFHRCMGHPKISYITQSIPTRVQKLSFS